MRQAQSGASTRRLTLMWAVATAVLTLALAAIVYELWRATFSVPLGYQGGSVFQQALVKTLIDGDGPVSGTADLRLEGERLHIAILSFLGWLTGDATMATNLFIVLAIPAAALAAFLACRALGLGGAGSMAAGVLYAFLPLHVSQAVERPMLAALWGVPVAGYLAVSTLRGRAFFDLDRGHSSWWTEFCLPLALAAIVALSGWLIGMVAATMITIAAIIGAIGRGARLFASGLVVSLAILAVVAISLAAGPAEPAPDGDVGSRPTEISSASRVDLAELVLPVRNHRVQRLAAAREAHIARHPDADGSSALGLAGSVGLGALFVAVVLRVGGRSRLRALSPYPREGILALGLLLVFGAGGAVATAGTVVPSLDRWTPVAAFIGFLALLAVGQGADRALHWAAARGRLSTAVCLGAVVLVVILGVADQTSPSQVPMHEAIAAAYAEDAAFVRVLEEQLPPDGTVFQLPVMGIGDATVVADVHPYDQLKPYLHARTSGWSGSDLAGHGPQWQDQLANALPRTLMPTIAALGFDAVTIQRDRYLDGGAAMEATLASILGEDSIMRSGERFVAFYLTDYRQSLVRGHGVEQLERLAVSAEAQGELDIAPFLPRLEPIAEGFVQPVGIVEVPDGSGQLAVVERGGLIRVVSGSGDIHPRPLLDVRNLVDTVGWEQGLLGLAFHPDFRESGRLFIHYTGQGDDVIVAEYRVPDGASEVDPASRRQILTVEKPGPFHNGGQLEFGPDGYLYAAFGDGVIDFPSSGPVGSGQDRSSLLGSIIRIDVDATNGEPYAAPRDNPFVGRHGRSEIWVHGLRNPWRFSFDSATGDLHIGDVGQLMTEEVNVQRAATGGGQNYGWRVMAGSSCFEQACDPTEFVLPAHEYAHGNGRCAVTGGYVYRGATSLVMYGRYVFGDLCSGQVWSMDAEDESPVVIEELDTDLTISTFGQLSDGELVVADYASGMLYQLDFGP